MAPAGAGKSFFCKLLPFVSTKGRPCVSQKRAWASRSTPVATATSSESARVRAILGEPRPEAWTSERDGLGDLDRASLEFDRGTTRPGQLRAKFVAHDRYAANVHAVREYAGFPTILVVTTSSARSNGSWPLYAPRPAAT